MEKPAETLTRDGVILRRSLPRHAKELHAVIEEARAHLSPWMPWAVEQDLDGSVEYLARSQEQWARGEAFNYSIFDEAGRLVGGCGLMTRRGPGSLEIGYWLHPAAVGRGVASKATRALVEAGFGLPGVDRIEIVHDSRNDRSGAVPRRLGFVEIERVPSERGTDVVWRLTRDGSTLNR